ncbi:MAG: apolipoprotein N-acyltransferase [Alistipes sp.]|jgi:apolipoprotein N-acyltransferase|nr:apolipoprotein N-acyltransferase [Alistipes sp.]
MENLKNLGLVVLASAMMSCGWMEATGLVMLGAFVPLLVLAGRHGTSKRDFARMSGWTALFIALWYGATVWWVWYATPAGPIAATFFAWVYTGTAFMLWFYISKRAPKALSYTVLVSAWIVGEWLYNTSQASFPWLAVGNGFAHDTWAVQWYEWTGAYGGTLWVLVTSVVIYEFLIVRRPFRARNLLAPGLAVVIPVIVSLAIYFSYDEPSRTAVVTIVQPNIDAWTEDLLPPRQKADNLVELAAEAPADAQFIVMPETAVGESPVEGNLAASPTLTALRDVAAAHAPGATVVVGATTIKLYGDRQATHTARRRDDLGWYDVFNAALAISPTGSVDIHHKAKMVIGAEMMPTWWWIKSLQKLVSNFEFYAGQYGFGTVRTVFENNGVRAGAGICWESVYGEYFSEFVRNGAEVLFVITNDGWWRDTPGHRQHFDFARLRAIETRRAVARSANTGRSGFITSRGDVGETMEWEERGTITADVALNSRMTFFVRFGDWPCRVALLVLGLSVLYFVAYRVRRKNLLVK